MSTALIVFGLLIAVGVALWASSDGPTFRIRDRVPDDEGSQDTPGIESAWRPDVRQVTVTDIDIPFGSMIWLLWKLVGATVVVTLSVGTVGFLLIAILMALTHIPARLAELLR